MSPKIDKQDNLHPYGLYQAPNAIDYKLNPRAFSPFGASFGITALYIVRKFYRGKVFFQITVARTYLLCLHNSRKKNNILTNLALLT